MNMNNLNSQDLKAKFTNRCAYSRIKNKQIEKLEYDRFIIKLDAPLIAMFGCGSKDLNFDFRSMYNSKLSLADIILEVQNHLL